MYCGNKMDNTYKNLIYSDGVAFLPCTVKRRRTFLIGNICRERCNFNIDKYCTLPLGRSHYILWFLLHVGVKK